MNKLAFMCLIGASMAVRINTSDIIGSKNIDPDVERFYDEHMTGVKVVGSDKTKASNATKAEPPAALVQHVGKNVSDVKMDPYVHGFVDNIVPATNTGRSETAPALNGPPSTLKGPEKKPAEKPAEGAAPAEEKK